MADNSVVVCVCPNCKATNTRSVAAMNYAETQVWNKSGTFSGAGVGFGAGGPSLVVGGGRYQERGRSATRRAATFDEPERANTPIIRMLALGGLMVLGFIVVASLVESAEPAVGRGLAQLDNLAVTVAKWVAPIAAALLLFFVGAKVVAAVRRDEEHNANAYPELMARYQELYYCERCHSLVDARGNANDAHERGFQAMMSIAPSSRVSNFNKPRNSVTL